jgi:preprotein translocase subunit SecE
MTSVATFFQELLRADIYKRSQGRITRQLTFAGMAIVVALGLWQLHSTMVASNYIFSLSYGIPSVLLFVGLWICFRTVNVPNVADFLIAVEAEMNKVSWPSRSELFRSSLVVLVSILVLAVVLTAFDFFWMFIFSNILHLIS